MMKLNGGFNLREIVFVEKCKAEYYNLGKKTKQRNSLYTKKEGSRCLDIDDD